MHRVKTEFTPGDLIADRYEVRRVLGRGGMGRVYLVTDRETGQRLALKTILPQYAANEYAVRRFIREVTAIRRFNHPAIVKIYDARRVGPLMFYTMDYVQGKSLRDWLSERGRLGLGSTVRILALLAHALEHAHQFTIHRDISPENVMILSNGTIRLLDFGLVKLTDADAAFTRIGISLGKQHYQAPEQRASAAEVDPRADIYSMGVLFYEMLSGKLPFPDVPLTELVPNLPSQCDGFVAKAMADLPEKRFATAQDDYRAWNLRHQELQVESDRLGSLSGAEPGDVEKLDKLLELLAKIRERRDKLRREEEAPMTVVRWPDESPE